MKEALKKFINNGMSGGNLDIPVHSPAINKATGGLPIGFYQIIGGLPGAGKTTLMVSEYLIGASNSMQKLNREYEFLIFSLDLREELLSAKAFSCIEAFEGNSVGVSDLGSRKNVLTEKQRDDYFSRIDEKLNHLDERTTIIDYDVTPKMVEEEIIKMAERNGEIQYRFVEREDGATEPIVIGYTPNDDKKVMIVMFDHFALVDYTDDGNERRAMSNLSKKFCMARDKLNCAVIALQQLNMDMFQKSIKMGGDIEPDLSHFGDNRALARDADIVSALINPHMLDIAYYKGYNLELLDKSMRCLFFLKTRWGKYANRALALFLHGKENHFESMPLPKSLEMSDFYDNVMKKSDVDNDITISNDSNSSQQSLAI